MKRLEKICDFIYPYKKIADIGCDHGYLIMLANDKYNLELAYAIDNKVGPLSQAKENLKKYNNVKYFVSDGLDSIDKNIDCVIIAGMGGCLIESILNKNIHTLKEIKRLIIQANRDSFKVRSFLFDNDFDIIDEDIVFEDGHYYEIDVFEQTNKSLDYSNVEIFFGPILLKNKPQIFVEKCSILKNKLLNVNNYKNEYNGINIQTLTKEITNICK